MCTTSVPVRTVTPSFSSWRRADAEQLRRVGREHAVDRLDQEDRGVLRVDRPEVAPQRVVARSRRARRRAPRPSARRRRPRTSSTPPLEPGPPRARRPRRRSGSGAGSRVASSIDLQARRVRRPVRRGRSRRDGRRSRRSACRRATGPPSRADPRRSASMPTASPSSTRRVALRAQDRAQRLRDLAGRQRSRRDLVEQRLEQVVVPPIDQGDVDEVAGPAEVLGGVQAGEAAADDDHAVRRRGGRAPWQGSCVHAANLRPTAVHAQWTDVGSRAA